MKDRVKALLKFLVGGWGPIATVAVFVAGYFLYYPRPARLSVAEEIAVDPLSPLQAVLNAGAPLRCEWDTGVGIAFEPVPLRNLHVARIIIRNVGGQPLKWNDET